MLRFFRQIRKKLMEQNKASTYLLYAIGEIALVMIGILLALQVNNWNEDIAKREKETAILGELRKNLETNASTLTEFIHEQTTRDKELDVIIHHIEMEKPYTDSLGIYLRQVRRGAYISLNSSAFESLQSLGFDLISNESLRYSIIDLHNQTYTQSLAIIESIRNVQYQSTHEIFVKYFSYSEDPFTTLKIHDYQAFLQNKEVYNLITFRKAGKEGVLNMAEKMLLESQKLIALVNKEIIK